MLAYKADLYGRRFMSRSVVERQLDSKFKDVSFAGKGSDIRIKIAGDYKCLSTGD